MLILYAIRELSLCLLYRRINDVLVVAKNYHYFFSLLVLMLTFVLTDYAEIQLVSTILYLRNLPVNESAKFWTLNLEATKKKILHISHSSSILNTGINIATLLIASRKILI